MSEKFSQKIMTAEMVLIVLPLSLLLAFATLGIFLLWDSWSWTQTLLLGTPLILMPWVALLSGVELAITFIKNGSSELKSKRNYIWGFCVVGAIYAIAGLIASLIHAFWINSASYEFEAQLILISGFAYASPLLIPFAHLILEKFLRKEITNL